MYVSSVSAQTMNMRYTYQSGQTAKAKEGQTSAKSEQSEPKPTETSEKPTNFSDVLSVMSSDISPINNIEAYINESVSKVLEKIAKYASNVLSAQSGNYSVSMTSINITIEMDPGESLSDVKSELDSMLSDDGYWGVEKTSQRMFDFAKGFAGDNPEEMSRAKEAVEKGFRQAEAMWGGKMPDISYDTFNATMQKFDNYIENISSSLSATYA